MIDSNDSFQVFNEHCVLVGNCVRFYGQYRDEVFRRQQIRGLEILDPDGKRLPVRVRLAKHRYDFFVDVPAWVARRDVPLALKVAGKILFDGMVLTLPPVFSQHSSSDVVVSTMLRNYGNRVEEWIRYHLSIGVSKIVIFDHGSTDDTADVVRGMKDPRVELIPFGYSSFEGESYEEIQRIALNLAAHGFKPISRWLVCIDADEFIFIPEMGDVDVRSFLAKWRYRWFKGLTMESMLLTNKGMHDLIDNNVLDLCRYSNLEPKYTKLILNTRRLASGTFLKSPHRIRGKFALPMSKIYHGHCWVNERLSYSSSFVERDEFVAVKRSNVA